MSEDAEEALRLPKEVGPVAADWLKFENEVRPFLDDISPCRSLWRHLDFRAAIGRSGDRWSLLALRIMLGDEEEQSRVLFDKGGLRIVQGSLPLLPASLDPLVNLLGPLFHGESYSESEGYRPAAEILRLAHAQDHVEAEASPDTWRAFIVALNVPTLAVPGFRTWHKAFHRDPNWLWRAADVPYFSLHSSSTLFRDLVDMDALQEALHRHAYDSLERLTSEKLGIPIDTLSSPSLVQVIAPVPLRVRGDVRHDAVHIQVTIPQAVERTDLSLTVETAGEGQDNQRIPVDLAGCKVSSSNNGRYELDCNLPIDQSVSTVRLQLWHCQQTWPIDVATLHVSRDPLLTSFSTFRISSGKSPVTELFVRYLLGKGNANTAHETKFEVAVLNLFALEGFATLYIGELDAPGADLIVSIANNQAIILVSVTIGGDIGKKLLTLLAARSDVRNVLPERLQTRAVIVTAVTRDKIPLGQQRECEEQGVSVLTREDLDTLWTVLRDKGPMEAQVLTANLFGIYRDVRY